MKRFYLPQVMIILIGLVSCTNQETPKGSSQMDAVKYMIQSVNEKNADNYITHFSDEVRIYLESDLKVEGRNNLRANRAAHFEKHPEVRSEIQHLVEIDNKVIMHDKVWLKASDTEGQDIVEVFTFEDKKITRVDVIQSKDLFQSN